MDFLLNERNGPIEFRGGLAVEGMMWEDKARCPQGGDFFQVFEKLAKIDRAANDRGMGRGQRPPYERDAPQPAGWSKQELVDAAGFSSKTFDTIRKAARVSGPSHGGNKHVFSAEDLMALVHRAESGSFSERGEPAAQAWRAMLVEAGLEMPTKLSPKRRR